VSRVVWKKLLLPDLSTPPAELTMSPYEGTLPNVRPYPLTSSDIPIPDPKAFRSMSRAAVFLAHVCAQAREQLDAYLKSSPFAVGVYCATENGPIDAVSTRKIIDQNDPARMAEHYRKFRNPKMYLKQLPNLAPAQMGIALGLQGPMNVYTHSTSASLHALDQAEWDLKEGVVRAALVCTAHAFDDFVIVRRQRRSDPRCLNEAAAAVLLEPDGKVRDWSREMRNDPENCFGISDPLINVLRD
jgi:3-oxoacyl-(acyl-carrier-protein) synthase